MSDLMQIIAKSRPAAKAAGPDDAFGNAASASRRQGRFAASQSRHAEQHDVARAETRTDRSDFADMVKNERIQNARAQQADAKAARIEAARAQDTQYQSQDTRSQNARAQDTRPDPQRQINNTDQAQPQRPEPAAQTREKVANALQDFSDAITKGRPDTIEKTGQDLLALLGTIEGETKLGTQISELVERVLQVGETDVSLTQAISSQAGPTLAGLIQADLTQASPTLASPALVSPTQANSTLASSTQANPTLANLIQPDLTQASPTLARPTQASSTQANPTLANLIQADLTQASPTLARPTQASPTQANPTLANLIQADLTQASPTLAGATPDTPALATIADMLAKINGGENDKPASPVLAAITGQQIKNPIQPQQPGALTPAQETLTSEQVLTQAAQEKSSETIAKSDPLLQKGIALSAEGLLVKPDQKSAQNSTGFAQPTAPADTKAQDPQTALANLADKLNAASSQPQAANNPTQLAAAALPATAPATTIVTASPDGALVQIELSANGTQTQVGSTAAPARSFAGNLPGQLNLPNLAFEISRQFANGSSRFEIRLDPPEMGRIDVRMEIDASGAVTARLSVEKSETLDYLQRDARALERALEEAGLKGGETNLEFTLKGQDQGTEAEDNDWLNFAENNEGESDSTDVIAAQMTHYSGIARPGGLNLLA